MIAPVTGKTVLVIVGIAAGAALIYYLLSEEKKENSTVEFGNGAEKASRVAYAEHRRMRAASMTLDAQFVASNG